MARATFLAEILAMIRDDRHDRRAEVGVLAPQDVEEPGELGVGVRERRVVEGGEDRPVGGREVAGVPGMPEPPPMAEARDRSLREALSPRDARRQEQHLRVWEPARNV